MKDNIRSGLFVQGLTLRDMWNHAFRIAGHQHTWFDNIFTDFGTGEDGQNSSFIMYVSWTPGYHQYPFVKSNTFTNFDSGTPTPPAAFIIGSIPTTH